MDENHKGTGASVEEQRTLLIAKQCMGCMHEGVITTAMDGAIVETSMPAELILEMPPAELRGRNIRELFADGDTFDEVHNQILRGESSRNRSVVLAAANGKRKVVNLSVQRVGEVESGKALYVFQDCSDLRSMEERLLQVERLAVVGKFASQIAHEIRNPLNSMSLNMELLEDELPASNQEARGLIKSVLKELERLNDIVGEYLQFARFPKPHLRRASVDVVIRGLIESFHPSERIQVHARLAPSTPEVWLDEGLFRQVLDNLIRNSVEAIDGEGSITIETEVIDRFVAIRVRDTGCGISDEARARLFEPFFTTKTRGTGLGLATSQQIIYEHGGHLLVESRLGKGSTFSILLPI